jgi:hypothetical protein
MNWQGDGWADLHLTDKVLKKELVVRELPMQCIRPENES